MGREVLPCGHDLSNEKVSAFGDYAECREHNPKRKWKWQPAKYVEILSRGPKSASTAPTAVPQ